MWLRCHAQGKLYTIGCPEGTRLVRACEVTELDHLIVPLKGKAIRIPADPPELLPLLAESGNFGVTLVGEPDASLAGVHCPDCGEADLAWLQLGEDSETVRCDRCGADFYLPITTSIRITASRHPGD